MDAKTAKEIAVKVAEERVKVSIKNNLDGIKVQIDREAGNGFRAAFFREKLPSFIVAPIVSSLEKEGFKVKIVDVPNEPNFFSLLTTW